MVATCTIMLLTRPARSWNQVGSRPGCGARTTAARTAADCASVSRLRPAHSSSRRSSWSSASMLMVSLLELGREPLARLVQAVSDRPGGLAQQLAGLRAGQLAHGAHGERHPERLR